MPKPTADQAPLLPGDIVQVTRTDYQGALVVVETVRRWGITGDAPHLVTRGPVSATIPLRLKHSDFERVGSAVLVSPDIAKARKLAIETAAALASETGA